METFLDKKLILRTDFSESNVIHSSEKQKSYLVVTETGKHLKVSPTSYFLLESFAKDVSVQKIAETLNVSVEKVNTCYENLTVKINELDRIESNRRKGFWFLWEIIPSNFVNCLAQPLSLMFHPIIVFLSGFLIFSGIFFNVQVGTFLISYSAVQNPQIFWTGYLLFFLSTLAHEFGHAGACIRYGAKPSGIGFTLYLIFPALYSDVTEAWKLKSGQRAIVGLGGIYFQLIFAAFYTLFGVAFDNDAFKIATLMIFGNCILNLNPFFRFDGYWILSDLLGVVNLSRQPKQIVIFLYNRLRGVKTNLPWASWVSLSVGIYSIGSILIIAFFITIYSSYFMDRIRQYPIVIQQFFNRIFNEESVSFSEIHTVFLSTATLVIFVYFLYNITLKLIFNKIKTVWDSTKL